MNRTDGSSYAGPVCERCGKPVVFDRIVGYWVHATTGQRTGPTHAAIPLARVAIRTRRGGIS